MSESKLQIRRSPNDTLITVPTGLLKPKYRFSFESSESGLQITWPTHFPLFVALSAALRFTGNTIGGDTSKQLDAFTDNGKNIIRTDTHLDAIVAIRKFERSDPKANNAKLFIGKTMVLGWEAAGRRQPSDVAGLMVFKDEYYREAGFEELLTRSVPDSVAAAVPDILEAGVELISRHFPPAQSKTPTT